MQKTSIFSKTNHDVYVITSMSASKSKCGFLATWVLPASLLPGTPRLLILASPFNETVKAIKSSKKFVIHMLQQSQIDLVPRFGLASSRDVDKFKHLSWQDHPYGPILADTVGYQLCELVQVIDIGERLILIGDTQEGEVHSERPPLTKQYAFANLAEDIVKELKAKHLELAAQSQSLFRPLQIDDQT